MRKFALFFMLALTASMVMVLSPIFAQEATVPLDEEITGDDMADEEITDDMTDEEITDDMTDEEITDDMTDEEIAGEDSEETSDESSMEETMEAYVDSPLKQMSMGIDPHQIQCKEGYKLVFKASNWHPACVKESSFQTLSSWGWISSHDPSEDDLTMMMQEHMAKYPKETEMEAEMETETEMETEMEESMTIDEDSSSVNGTSTDEPEPKSTTIELRESMDMGNQ